jgi:hypothetical protein
MQRVTSMLKLYFVIENSYFDTLEYSDNPIKKYLKPYYLTSRNNTSFYYYMLISQNEVTLSDTLLLGSKKEATFIETRVDYQIE